ncbi:DUF2975 domain-containing protein [Croceicoccus naphthovorans]|uniref:Uncharacterized protein n=1 Tax=Croceicoccus naphthovorans TaxID=1348774 RepID=A0A0G3XK92_9SPHN|nr:DUF2975 domain-containing protein [Croceicoccus naphthovorans]AKM11009.1 hypothetical protein AB433_15185 [Croceicoccus naphthovorans]MBB3989572.1 hypothetical protein [Croceicoccus naphthovorans]
MPKVARDPLLAVARVVLVFLQLISGFAAISLAIALPAVLIFRSSVLAEFAEEGVSTDAFWPMTAMIVLGLATAVLVFVLVRLTRRIVDTVALGDPFVPDNAQRLSLMAWCMLAIQIVTIPLATFARQLESITEGTPDTELSISLSGLLFVLVLFILARVFRKGTEMRSELEGTV